MSAGRWAVPFSFLYLFTLNLDQRKLFSVGTSPRTKLIVGSMCLLNHSHGKLFVQTLTIISKLISGLAIRNFVVRKPGTNLLKLAREDSFNIFNIIDFSGIGIVSTDGNYLPIDFTLINHGKGAERLDFVDTPRLAGNVPDFDNVNRIIIALKKTRLIGNTLVMKQEGSGGTRGKLRTPNKRKIRGRNTQEKEMLYSPQTEQN